MQIFLKLPVLGALAVLTAAQAASASVVFPVISTMDGNAHAIVDATPSGGTPVATVGSGTGGAISSGTTTSPGAGFTSFNAAVGSAYAANTGGVIDFDNGTFAGTDTAAAFGSGATDPATATYGVSGTSSLGFYRNDGSGTFSVGTDAGDAASGSNYLGFAGGPTPFSGTIALTSGVQDLGVIMIARGAARTATLLATYSGTTSGTYTSTGSVTATSSQGVFFGFAAPTGDLITSVSASEASGGLVRFDDLGFITTTTGTPEPASMSLLGLGTLTLLRRRRA